MLSVPYLGRRLARDGDAVPAELDLNITTIERV
jgi:hypothetical protein